MRVTIRRHGGFAGASETVAVKDSAQLASPDSAALRTTLVRIRKLAREHRAVGADLVNYELLIDDSGSQAVVSFADDGSEEAQQLVQLVNTLSTR